MDSKLEPVLVHPSLLSADIKCNRSHCQEYSRKREDDGQYIENVEKFPMEFWIRRYRDEANKTSIIDIRIDCQVNDRTNTEQKWHTMQVWLNGATEVIICHGEIDDTQKVDA